MRQSLDVLTFFVVKRPIRDPKTAESGGILGRGDQQQTTNTKPMRFDFKTPTPEDLPRPILAVARDYPPGHTVPRHHHKRAQLVHAESGTMVVTTDDGVWMVPPERAVWVPAGVDHCIETGGQLAMRSLYVEPHAAPNLPRACCVVDVPPLLRSLILAAIDIPPLYDLDGPDGRMMRVLVDQLERLSTAPLHLPMPSDTRLKRVAEALLRDPADGATLDQWARRTGASPRTLARLFARETGLTFGAWRQRLRLLKACEMLAARRPVTQVALELGYDSASAFIAMFRRAFGVPPKRYFRERRPA